MTNKFDNLEKKMKELEDHFNILYDKLLSVEMDNQARIEKLEKSRDKKMTCNKKIKEILLEIVKFIDKYVKIKDWAKGSGFERNCGDTKIREIKKMINKLPGGDKD